MGSCRLIAEYTFSLQPAVSRRTVVLRYVGTRDMMLRFGEDYAIYASKS